MEPIKLARLLERGSRVVIPDVTCANSLRWNDRTVELNNNLVDHMLKSMFGNECIDSPYMVFGITQEYYGSGPDLYQLVFAKVFEYLSKGDDKKGKKYLDKRLRYALEGICYDLGYGNYIPKKVKIKDLIQLLDEAIDYEEWSSTEVEGLLFSDVLEIVLDDILTDNRSMYFDALLDDVEEQVFGISLYTMGENYGSFRSFLEDVFLDDCAQFVYEILYGCAEAGFDIVIKKELLNFSSADEEIGVLVKTCQNIVSNFSLYSDGENKDIFSITNKDWVLFHFRDCGECQDYPINLINPFVIISIKILEAVYTNNLQFLEKVV